MVLKPSQVAAMFRSCSLFQKKILCSESKQPQICTNLGLGEKPDPVKAMLWPKKCHSGLHFDDCALSTTRDGEMGQEKTDHVRVH